MSSPIPRPAGVVALVVLQIIGGFVSFIAGAVFISISEEAYRSSAYRGSAYQSPDAFLAILGALGPFFVLGGLFKFLLAWGLWAGRSWARITAMVFAAISLLGIPVGTIIGALLLYYLTRPPVEAFFGKGPPVPAPAAPSAAPPPAPYAPAPAAPPSFVLCPGCRATIPGDAVFCGKCGMDLRPKAPAAPPPASPRHCTSCGAAVSSNTRFCPTCGGRVA